MIEIYDPIEQAIIKAFEKSNNAMLPRKAIIKEVKNQSDKNDNIIIKKIEKLVKLKYLMKTSSRGIYKLNRDFKFELVGQTPPPISDSREPPFEVRKKHSDDLKEAINVWITYFPKSRFDHCCLGSVRTDVFKNSEQHILFQDLINHLPIINPEICNYWKIYKKEMEILDLMKIDLSKSLNEQVAKCFETLDLDFAPHFLCEYQIEPNDKCEPLQCYLYFYILEQLSDGLAKKKLRDEIGYPDSPEYSEYENAISDIKRYRIYKKYYLESLGYCKSDAPIEVKEKLDRAIYKFYEFFNNLLIPEYLELSNNIIEKVCELSREREKIIRELQRILFYSSLPGNCEYIV
jgi:hypothetical protein